MLKAKDEYPTKLGRFNNTLSTEIGKGFCNYLKTLGGMFLVMTKRGLRTLAYEVAEKKSILHPVNRETRTLGKELLHNFLKRLPD